MSGVFGWIRRFVGELRRRRVIRVAVVYATTAFVVLQLGEILVEPFGLGDWALRFVLFLLVLGFPLAVGLAWVYNITEEGLTRTEKAERTATEIGPGGKPLTSNGLIVGLLIIAIGLLLYPRVFSLGDETSGQASPATPDTTQVNERSIAVLPFEVSGAGAEEWRDGMVTTLSLNLDGAAGLRAVAARTVLAAWERREGVDIGLGTEEAIEVARQVGARYAVIGEAVQLGEDLRFGTEVYETSSGTRLGQVEARGAPGEVTALTNELSQKVLGVLLEKSEEQIPSVDLASITTASLPALKAFLRGERHLRKGEYEASIEDYEAAVKADSTFALAYARLENSKGWVVEPGQEEALRRAYELSERLPPRERRLIEARYIEEVQGHGFEAADSLRRLTNDYPEDPNVWYWFGEALFHNSVPRGWPEAERAFEEAAELDPDVAPYNRHLMDLAFSLHQDSALAARRIRAHPDKQAKRFYQTLWDLKFGAPDAEKDAWSRLDTLSNPSLNRARLALRHPSDRALQEQVIRRLSQRGGVNRAAADRFLFQNHLKRGQIKESVSLLPKRLRARLIGLVPPLTLGYPVPDSLLRPHLEPSQIESDASPPRLAMAIIYSIEKERFGDVDPLLERWLDATERESIPDHRVERGMNELKGLRAWKAGNLERAERLWSRLKLGGSGEYGALWRGDLYRTLGQLREAEGWYQAAWGHPVAHERLGQLYEEMGRPQEAAEAYERFIAAWKDADPELQDRVEKARNRIDALGETVAAE